MKRKQLKLDLNDDWDEEKSNRRIDIINQMVMMDYIMMKLILMQKYMRGPDKGKMFERKFSCTTL